MFQLSIFVRIFLFLTLLDIFLIVAGIASIRIARANFRFSLPIVREGVAISGSLGESTAESVKTNPIVGVIFLIAAICGYIAGWIFLLTAPVFTVVAIYFAIFYQNSF